MVNGLEAIQIDRDIAILWLNDWIDSDSNWYNGVVIC